MATIDDIMDAVAALIAGALYPTGTAVPSVAGCHVKVYPGWPVDHKISEDMRLGVPHVSVFKGNTEAVFDSSLNEWREHSREAMTLTVTVDEGTQTIVIGGAYSTPQNVGALVAGKPFIVAAQENSTPITLAAALAALIDADPALSASSSGPTVTLMSGPHTLKELRGTWGTEAREVRRSMDQVIVTIWAPTPALRRTLSGVLEVVLSRTRRLNLPDGSRALMRYVKSAMQDNQQKAVIFWRDLIYEVVYSTIETRDAPEIVVVEQNTAGNQVGDPGPIVTTIYGGP